MSEGGIQDRVRSGRHKLIRRQPVRRLGDRHGTKCCRNDSEHPQWPGCGCGGNQHGSLRRLDGAIMLTRQTLGLLFSTVGLLIALIALKASARVIVLILIVVMLGELVMWRCRRRKTGSL